jgi:hypothetical protein
VIKQRSPEPTYAELEAALAIDKDNLDEDVARHSDLFHRVMKRLELAISRRDEVEKKLGDLKAEVEMKIRREAADNDDKVTGDEVKARVRLDREVRELGDLVLVMERRVKGYTVLKESYKSRSYALNNLCDLYATNYFGRSTRGSKVLREQAIHQVQEDRRAERMRQRQRNDKGES